MILNEMEAPLFRPSSSHPQSNISFSYTQHTSMIYLFSSVELFIYSTLSNHSASHQLCLFFYLNIILLSTILKCHWRSTSGTRTLIYAITICPIYSYRRILFHVTYSYSVLLLIHYYYYLYFNLSITHNETIQRQDSGLWYGWVRRDRLSQVYDSILKFFFIHLTYN